MADTRQCVFWSLERACALRKGEGWQLPIATSMQLSRLKSCSDERNKAKPDIVDGIWVTSQYWGHDAANRSIYIPSSGVKIDEIARDYGGWDLVRNTCQNCVANVLALVPPLDSSKSRKRKHDGDRDSSHATPSNVVGGCFGSLEVLYPGSGSFDDLLWGVIEEHDLEAKLRDAFRLTDPLWFGFWMDSPLDRKQCRCLLELLSKALPQLWEKPEDDPAGEPLFGDVSFAFADFNPAATYGREYALFFHALEAVLQHDLKLHVHVPPPGHTDMGFYTVFAHCPRCKAAADVPRWEEVKSCNYECTVCGYHYDPKTTYSSESSEYDSNDNSLESMLGDQYDDFVIRYGLLHGHSREQMIEALDIHRDGPRKRQVAKMRKRVNEALQRHRNRATSDESQKLPNELLIELASGIVMEFVLIPAGEFQMGETPAIDQIKWFLPDYDPEKNGNCVDTGKTFDWCDSMPIHTVRFNRPFYIGKYPVTQSQWRAVTGNNPSKCRFENHPVEQVDWFAAQDFCIQLSERLGRVIRLPSEAEWEYACRAGTQTRCYCGEEVGREYANLDHDTTDADFFSMDKSTNPQTTPVDRYPPNPWGIYDMLGNVEEWCQDSWHSNYIGSPSDGSAWIDKPEPIEHVARGGAAYLMAKRCSCGFRRSQRANCGADPQSDEQTMDVKQGNSFASWKSNEYFGLRIVSDALSDFSSLTT